MLAATRQSERKRDAEQQRHPAYASTGTLGKWEAGGHRVDVDAVTIGRFWQN